MPNAVSQDEEVRINAENLEILDTWDLFFSDHCDEKGSIRHSNNLTKEEMLGKCEIQEGIKSRGWVLYGTDKSRKLVLDTLENFNSAMEPHYAHEQEVTIDEVHNSENSLNNHSKSWARILSF